MTIVSKEETYFSKCVVGHARRSLANNLFEWRAVESNFAMKYSLNLFMKRPGLLHDILFHK